MKTQTSAMVLAIFLAGSAEAVQHRPHSHSALQYRPYVDGRTPWYKTSPSSPATDFPHNYFVPNNGVDHEIKFTKDHIAAAEAKLGHVLQASFKKPAPPGPQDYFVPNFGEDSDIKYTKQHIQAAEGNLGHVMAASFSPPAPPPQNYFVPNFGADHDIKETQKHAAAAEQTLGHVWQKGSAPDHPTGYFVPNFGEDSDVKNTQAHIAAAEAKLGHKYSASFAQPDGPPMNYPVAQFGQDHDIKDSLYHTQAAEAKLGAWNGASFKAAPEPPMNYFVPDFGLDHDVKVSLGNTANAEKKLGPWNEYNMQSGVDVHLESDPICSSAGCDQYKHKKKERGYKINYPVPNFGRDTDMIDTDASLEIAEGMKQHKLIMGTEESKAKWHNVAKDTDYNFAPKLDADIIYTNKNLDDAQIKLNHKWLLA